MEDGPETVKMSKVAAAACTGSSTLLSMRAAVLTTSSVRPFVQCIPAASGIADAIRHLRKNSGFLRCCLVARSISTPSLRQMLLDPLSRPSA